MAYGDKGNSDAVGEDVFIHGLLSLVRRYARILKDNDDREKTPTG
ncbi:hypothetical protein VIAG107301_02355 [Vibrio agarivorans]